LLLVQAGAAGMRPTPGHPGTPSPACTRLFRVDVVLDVTGKGSSGNAEVLGGARSGAADAACHQVNVLESTRPSDYRANLQMAADRHSDIVIAASFLLGDAVVNAARDNPATRFILVDPLVARAGPANLALITFRADQAGFLAGALAGLTTRSGTVAGVYGPEDDADRRYRAGFEGGVGYVNPRVKALGTYQGSGNGVPFANPAWGEDQARAFMRQGADVIFGAGGTTGQGALRAAAQAGMPCIGLDDAASYEPAAACLLASATTRRDRAVEKVVAELVAGTWMAGRREFGIAEGAIGLSRLSVDQPVRQRLESIAGLLATGRLTTGA
jgi:basic membrane protein A and related proteins